MWLIIDKKQSHAIDLNDFNSIKIVEIVEDDVESDNGKFMIEFFSKGSSNNVELSDKFISELAAFATLNYILLGIEQGKKIAVIDNFDYTTEQQQAKIDELQAQRQAAYDEYQRNVAAQSKAIAKKSKKSLAKKVK